MTLANPNHHRGIRLAREVWGDGGTHHTHGGADYTGIAQHASTVGGIEVQSAIAGARCWGCGEQVYFHLDRKNER